MKEYQCRIKPHGRFQTELKVRYPVDKNKQNYGLDLYIFSPRVLSIDRTNYGIGLFLKDIKVMTRISTPEINLSRLMDDDCDYSPIVRIKSEMAKINSGTEIKDSRVLYELRTLACIVRVQIRKSRLYLKRKLDKGEDVSFINNWLTDYLKEIATFLQYFRNMKSLFINPDIEQNLNMAFDWADESISLNVQRELGILAGLSEKHEEIKTCTPGILEMIKREGIYRKERGFHSLISFGKKRADGEDVIYRESILKKWSQSVMYLNEQRGKTPANAAHIFAGAAAAIAMTFAVLATVITDRFFPDNTTVWALAAVIAYILKDRIKETLRSGLRILAPGLMPDRMSVLKDSSDNRRIGHTKSFVSFFSGDEASDEIKYARGWHKKPFRDILPSEDVIQYEHQVKLDGRKLFIKHKRLESVTEIIRIELHKFLQLMDDPDQIYYFAEEDELIKKRLRRVYHLNFIVVLTNYRTSEKETLHYRLILNREGIHRIELVNP